MINTNKIKILMKDKGVTQEDVSKVLGISRPTVSQKINSMRAISLDEALLLADYLDIDMKEFKDYFFYHPVA